MRTLVLSSVLALALAACSPPETAKDGEAAPAGAAPAGETASSAPAGINLYQAIGSWVIGQPECATDTGLMLRANGEAWDEGPGMWAIDDQGRIVLITREHEMGMETDENAPRHVKVLTIASVSETQMSGIDHEGAAFTAYRCPDEIVDAERAALGAAAGRTP